MISLEKKSQFTCTAHMRPVTYLMLALLIICSSCSKQYQALFEKRTVLADSTVQKNVANIVNYRIKSQDILQIRNLQNSKSLIDLNPLQSANATSSAGFPNGTPVSDTYQVEDDGTVALTDLGHVQVAGLTRMQAEKYIESLYKKDLKNPVIELKIINLKVTLFGETKTQTSLPLTKDRVTLVEILGEAGGLTEKADEKHVEIIRGSPEPTVIVVDLSDIKSITDPKTILQSGDIVYVPQNKRAIRNDKISNLSSILQPGLLIFSSVLLIVTLLRR